MIEDKRSTIVKLFEGREIRSVWDAEKEDYYFSVVDVIRALTNSGIPKRYWTDLKRNLIKEGSELYENIVRLKLTAQDGKLRETDTLDTEGIFRLIESIPSKKAEPFKLWLAKLGREEIDRVFDPSKGIDKMIEYYLKKGYDLEWIEARIKAIVGRKKLTNTWRENGIKEEYEYAVLTNEIYKEWSGMTAKEYKEYKNIRKESLRDNMTDMEVALTDLGEIATRELSRKHNPQGLVENKKIARIGGHTAKVAKDEIEKHLKESVVTSTNHLRYQYVEERKQNKLKQNDQ